MLELQNVTIKMRSDDRVLVESFSFALADSDKAVIIGEEGNGKSTLLQFIYDRELIEGYCDCTGTLRKDGKLGYLSQTASDEMLNTAISDLFADKEYYSHVRILEQMEIPLEMIFSERKLSTFSGGEKVKLRLAYLLMDDPDVLLLDEPTNDLDIEALEWMEEFIRSSRIPIMFISHDETLIENSANVIIHMEQLRSKTTPRITVVRCSYSDYLQFRAGSFEHQRQVAQKQRDDYDKQMERWRQIYSKVEHDQNSVSRGDPSGGRLLKKKMHSVLSLGRRLEREADEFVEFPETETAILTKFDPAVTVPAGKTVIDLELDKVTAGDKLLAQNVQLFLSGPEHVGITGKNGAGKSTLLDIIWNKLKDRTDVVAAYMPQDYSEVLEYDLSPVEYLASHYSKDEVTKARTYMGSMRFTRPEMTGKIGELSGGQKAKILFLDMVLRNANVLVLDEPTRNFSPLSCPVIRDAIRNYKGAVISVSHDRKYLNEVCDRVLELDQTGLHETNRFRF